jgi:hypothetical protein
MLRKCYGVFGLTLSSVRADLLALIADRSMEGVGCTRYLRSNVSKYSFEMVTVSAIFYDAVE